MGPDQHYEEAERLLTRSAKLTEDWVERAKDNDTGKITNVALLNLEILARMLTSRANVHAKLATANYTPKPEPVKMPASNPNGRWPQYHQEIVDTAPL